MIVADVEDAVASGARQAKACELLGMDPRTLQRWKAQGPGEDQRAGPRTAPGNALTKAEREEILWSNRGKYWPISKGNASVSGQQAA